MTTNPSGRNFGAKRRRRFQGRAFRRHPGFASRTRLFRGPRRELHGRGRSAAPAARGDPRPLSAVAARRRACRSARPGRSTAPISPGWRASRSAISRLSSPSISPGRRTMAHFSTICCPCPTRTKRWRASANTSTSCKAALRRTILLENPSTYVAFAETTIGETEFLSEIVRRTGCGLLLDVNNVFVCAANHGFDPQRYLARFPFAAVGEIHLAGYADDRDDAGLPLLIDAHNSPVREPVWALYAEAIRRLGPTPTLIEWDNDLPAWTVLLAEARRAERAMAAALLRRRSASMSFEATIAAFAAALRDPAPAPAAWHTRPAWRAGRAPLRGLSQQCRGRADRRARGALSGRRDESSGERRSGRWRAPSSNARSRVRRC